MDLDTFYFRIREKDGSDYGYLKVRTPHKRKHALFCVNCAISEMNGTSYTNHVEASDAFIEALADYDLKDVELFDVDDCMKKMNYTVVAPRAQNGRFL